MVVSRGRRLAAGACVVLLSVVLASCSPGGSARSLGPAPSGTAMTPGGSDGSGSSLGVVDPQVLSDVIDGTFYVPGDAMVRAMRVSRAISSIVAVDCGGEPFENLDFTGDRFDQAYYPDLALIAAKNLVESGPKPAGDRVGADTPCRYKSLPLEGDWLALNMSWDDVTRAELLSDQMLPVLESTAACLSQKSGFKITSSDPTVRYLNAVDNDLSGDGTDWDTGMAKYSQIYVACTADYASTLRTLLPRINLKTPHTQSHQSRKKPQWKSRAHRQVRHTQNQTSSTHHKHTPCQNNISDHNNQVGGFRLRHHSITLVQEGPNALAFLAATASELTNMSTELGNPAFYGRVNLG